MSSVEAIVSAKKRPVITIEPEAAMVAAAKLLAEHRIGLLMVVNKQGTFIGVLTERDIVRAVAAEKDLVHGAKVDEYVTKKVVACRPQTSVDDVFRTMQERGFRHMPVVDRGRVIGVLSIGDVLKHMVMEAKDDKETLTKINAVGVF
jgi:CBS domain-containing protein